jgi:Recombinase zinc beta ribbon domain
MLADNSAEDDRNKTRGIPRPGAALLHGLVHCGECGHKMVVQYKGGTRYLCNFLHQKYHVPVCQHIPGDSVDPYIVEAFFQVLSAIELDVYSRAVATQQDTIDQVSHANGSRTWNVCATRRSLPSASSCALTLTIASLPPRWRSAGTRPFLHANRLRKPRPNRTSQCLRC